MGSARIKAGEDCVLAGLDEAIEVFNELGVTTYPMTRDGEKVSKGEDVLVLEGLLKKILLGERLALNFLMRMSGIATVTSNVVRECRRSNPSVKVAATRKTTPGFQILREEGRRARRRRSAPLPIGRCHPDQGQSLARRRIRGPGRIESEERLLLEEDRGRGGVDGAGGGSCQGRRGHHHAGQHAP